MKDYFIIEYGENGTCRPCQMHPLASMYLGELEKAGKKDDAEKLQKVYEGGDILTIAEELDNIKKRVGEELRQNLEELDCFTQSFTEDGNEDAKD